MALVWSPRFPDNLNAGVHGMIKPLFNMCKIEIIDDYAGVLRDNKDEQVQKGVLIDFHLSSEHITASTGHSMAEEFMGDLNSMLKGYVGKTVNYAQYADSGQVIEEDGKKYAYVPFYRLIGVEE